ncbi:MAG: hypothetical protein LBM93_09295, partial [Oscillospiraceae bacterium]|nr:hypothetical protein [Oscillospiraceae bacterium]
RWLFDPQFDSPMYVSNSALSTVIKKLFKESDYDLEFLANPRKRPDIVCLKNYTLKAVCTERADIDAGNITKPDQVLIIELKRGGYEIGQDEVAQAENYVRQIRKSAMLHSKADIYAYVVGATIGDVDPHKITSSGHINVISYAHLVDDSRKKLFNLREKLDEHYKKLGDDSIVENALKQQKFNP